MLFQISVASLGCEAVFQSLSLMIMTDLVAGKVAPISAKANLLKHISNAVKKRSVLQQAEDSELAGPSSVTQCPDKATPSATMTIAVATTAANVLAAAVTFARILGGDRRAVKFRIFMAALNTIAAVETALGAVFMYGTSGIVSLKYEAPISALVHLGVWLLQLEMRLLFLLLFSNDLRAGWTESGKNYARATVFAIHMVLWWPVYIYKNVEFTSFMTLWWTYGPTVALFIQAIVTFAQSYIIITTLLRRSKALNCEVTTEQHTVLIISLAVSLVAELCGIVAFLMMSIFLNPAADPDHYWLVVQVAVTAVGWKTLSESLALSRMVRIVAGKQSVARVNSHIVKLMTKIPNLKRSKEYRSSDIATHRSQPVPTSSCAGPPPSMAEQ